ncbi:MAG: hypothetical protein IIZ93_14675 [Acidaminococcaceae bacterium]|nr:hypothetical protein [Acidaminococcaceae bacterium]
MRLIDAIGLKQALAVSAILEDKKTIEQIIDEQPTIEQQHELSGEESEMIYRIGYEKGKLDGIKYCTEHLKKMKDSFCGADMRGDSDEA